MNIEIKKSSNLILPSRGTDASSGYDIITTSEPNIIGQKDERDYWKSIDYIEYKTELFISPKQDNYGNKYHTLIMPRSSVRKYNLILANSIALIDNDYRGELILCFKYIFQPEDMVLTTLSFNENYENKIIRGTVNYEKIYKKGDKIGQLVSEVSNTIDWVVVDTLSLTERNSDGFGSTDIKNKNGGNNNDLLEKWKEYDIHNQPTPLKKYESIMKEREKLILG